MNYPSEIIPKDFYSKKINLDRVIKDSKRFFVCRVAEEPVENYIHEDFDGSPILDLDLFEEHVVNMSVNLMGGWYNESHLPFRTLSKHKASDAWNGDKINLDAFDGGYKTLTQAYPIYYSSEFLHRQPLPSKYLNPDNGRAKSLQMAFGKKCCTVFKNEIMDEHKNGKNKGTREIENITVTSEIFIVHHPTNLNYWHMQVEMKPALEDDSAAFKNDKSWRKDIYVQFISDILTKKFTLSIPEDAYVVPCAYYNCNFSRNCLSKYQKRK